VAQQQGDVGRATALFEESLSIFRELDNTEGITYSLAGLAVAICAKGQARDAVKLFGAVDASLQSTEAAIPRADRFEYEGTRAVAQAALSPSAFAAAWVEGQALDLAQAIAFALKSTGIES
jgi:hypothetical protein